MPGLTIHLFGKFSAEFDGWRVEGLDGNKLQELFCYLLLNQRPHSREVLAATLWGGSPTAQSKKYLRQALWQIQTALCQSEKELHTRLLVVDADWVNVNSEGDYWFDVREFEQSFGDTQGTPGHQFDRNRAAKIAKAIDLYRGDLLEGCYDDWCLFERERLQNMYLMMLDKLMAYSEAVGEYDNGISYGARILSCDRAREHTHRRLMRIYYLADDRTSALRQYERCTAALQEELGVKPARKTSHLFEQICSDRLEALQPLADPTDARHAPASQMLEALGYLRQLKTALVGVHRHIKHDIHTLEVLLKGKRS